MPNIIYQKEILYPEILWERPVHYYKVKAGRIFILAGSLKYSQAPIQTSEAAFKIGTGIQTIGFPDSLTSTYKNIIPEAMSLALPSNFSGSFSKKAKDSICDQLKSSDVFIVGPGISKNSETSQLIWNIIPKVKIPLIITSHAIDVIIDGIDAMRKEEDLDFISDFFSKLKYLILVVNKSDLEKFSKSLKLKKAANFEEGVSNISEFLSCTIIVNSKNTIIASKKGKIVKNSFGNSKLKLDGVNNILAGVIGSFISQNPKGKWKSTLTGSYIYDLALDIAIKQEGEQATRSSDILKYMKEAIRSLENE